MLTMREWRALVYCGAVLDTIDDDGRKHDERGRFARKDGGAVASKGSIDKAAVMPRKAFSLREARAAAKDFQGRPLTNRKMTATVSRNSLDKMLSQSAVGKSTSVADHALAVANLDHLFENATYGWSKPDRDSNPNIKAVHRLFAPMDTSSGTKIVKLTVKEVAQGDRQNKIYTVESIDINEKSPASIWVGEIAAADGIDPRTTPYARDMDSLELIS